MSKACNDIENPEIGIQKSYLNGDIILMKRKFFDTCIAKFAGLDKQSTSVLKYIIENQNCIIPMSEIAQMTQNVRMILKTPMAEFFDRILSNQGLGNFTALYLTNAQGSVPEMLTTTSLTLDTKQLDNAIILKSLPEVVDKIIVNLSTAVKPDKAAGRLAISAIDTMLNIYVRGYLVASYEDSDGWLTPYLGEYATRTYSMILSSVISRYYNLSIPETMLVMRIFALFFTQLLGGENDDPVMPAMYNRCTFCGNRAELIDTAKLCAYKSKDGLDITSVCELIVETGPERISTLNISAFYALAGNIGQDIISTQIALEYPPYWVYTLILALSGQKIPMVYQLNSQRLVQEGRSKFLQQILIDSNLFTVQR